MTHHRTPRDGSGRFVKRTEPEKVAAHVERVSQRHPQTIKLTTSGNWTVPDDFGGDVVELPKPEGDRAASGRFIKRTVPRKVSPGETISFPAGISKPTRTQPLEYDRPSFLAANWGWLASALLVLIGLTVYLAR